MKKIDNIMTEVKEKFPELKPSKHLLIVDIYMQAFKDGFREAGKTALEAIESGDEEGELAFLTDPNWKPTSITHYTNKDK